MFPRGWWEWGLGFIWGSWKPPAPITLLDKVSQAVIPIKAILWPKEKKKKHKFSSSLFNNFFSHWKRWIWILSCRCEHLKAVAYVIRLLLFDIFCHIFFTKPFQHKIILHPYSNMFKKCRLLLWHCQVMFWTFGVYPGTGCSVGRLGYSRELVLNSHLTNLDLGVIRPTLSLASTPVTDRITLNHLHSGGVLHLVVGVTISLMLMGNTPLMETGWSIVVVFSLLFVSGNVWRSFIKSVRFRQLICNWWYDLKVEKKNLNKVL